MPDKNTPAPEEKGIELTPNPSFPGILHYNDPNTGERKIFNPRCDGKDDFYTDRQTGEIKPDQRENGMCVGEGELGGFSPNVGKKAPPAAEKNPDIRSI